MRAKTVVPTTRMYLIFSNQKRKVLVFGFWQKSKIVSNRK
jgi:hypothetical protein